MVLIANVAHDLRTPLASLRSYLETLLLKEDTLPVQQRRSYLEIASRQSAHLTALVAQLFELAQLDFKGFKVNREPVELDELARDAVEKFELSAEKKGVALKIEAAASVPYVLADIGLIERALENLIENALKHSPSEGKVALTIDPHESEVRVQVADNGGGISKEDLPFIFDRFYRGDKSQGSAGAGLELAITKPILELHWRPDHG